MKRVWLTEIRAIDPWDGEMKTWAGPSIEAPNWSMAEKILQLTGRGYATVIGELVSKKNEDLSNEVDYGIISQN